MMNGKRVTSLMLVMLTLGFMGCLAQPAAETVTLPPTTLTATYTLPAETIVITEGVTVTIPAETRIHTEVLPPTTIEITSIKEVPFTYTSYEYITTTIPAAGETITERIEIPKTITTHVCPSGYYWNIEYGTCAPVQQGPPGWFFGGSTIGGIPVGMFLLIVGAIGVLLYMARRRNQ